MNKNWLEIHWQWNQANDGIEIIAIGEQEGEKIHAKKAVSFEELKLPE